MHGVAEGTVDEGEDEADDEQEEEEDPSHPCECDEGGEQPAFEVLVAPVEVAPESLFAQQAEQLATWTAQ